MSEEAEFLKHLYESFNARDMESALAAMHRMCSRAGAFPGRSI